MRSHLLVARDLEKLGGGPRGHAHTCGHLWTGMVKFEVIDGHRYKNIAND